MRVRLNVDFDHSQPISKSLALIERYGGKIENFEAKGPAGGNPMFDLSFPSRSQGLKFLREHSPDDSRAFANSRLTDDPASTLTSTELAYVLELLDYEYDCNENPLAKSSYDKIKRGIIYLTPNKSEKVTYHADNERGSACRKHHWTCDDCGKILQVG